MYVSDEGIFGDERLVGTHPMAEVVGVALFETGLDALGVDGDCVDDGGCEKHEEDGDKVFHSFSPLR